MITIDVRLGTYGEGARIGRMTIENDKTGTETHGNYSAKISVVDQRGVHPVSEIRVENFPRQNLHVWELVRRVLMAADAVEPQWGLR